MTVKKAKKTIKKAVKKTVKQPVKKAVKKPVKTTATKKPTQEAVAKKKTTPASAAKKVTTKKVVKNAKTSLPSQKDIVEKIASTPKGKRNITQIKKPKFKKVGPTRAKSTMDEKEKGQNKASMMLEARKRKSTPSIFKIKSRKHTPIVFTLEDVKEVTEKRALQKPEDRPKTLISKKHEIKKIDEKILKEAEKKKVQQAASIFDILGFNPNETKRKNFEEIEEESIEKKYLPYYKELVKLRKHFIKEIDEHSQETLKRSAKEDSGDLSSYGQHMADAGTETFERDFALSMLANEQDALFEIEEAIQRIKDGLYGICEITGQKITSERLLAVPFTRYSIEGQRQLESTQRRKRERAGIFGEESLEDSVRYTDEDLGD